MQTLIAGNDSIKLNWKDHNPHIANFYLQSPGTKSKTMFVCPKDQTLWVLYKNNLKQNPESKLVQLSHQILVGKYPVHQGTS